MTVIAIKVENDKITIGADSQLTKGSSQRQEKGVKLFEVHGMVVGMTGNVMIIGLFRMFATTTKPKSATEADLIQFMADFNEFLRKRDEKNNCEFLLVFEKKVFYIADLLVLEITDYYTLGTGEDYAMSALYLGNSVKEAIQAACHLSIYCEEPIEIIQVLK